MIHRFPLLKISVGVILTGLILFILGFTQKPVLADDPGANQVTVTPATMQNYFNLAGTATVDRDPDTGQWGTITLTPDARVQNGSAQLSSRLDFTHDFHFRYDMYFNPSVGSGYNSDGMSFVLFPGQQGAQGMGGGNVGISGLPYGEGFKVDSHWNGYTNVGSTLNGPGNGYTNLLTQGGIDPLAQTKQYLSTSNYDANGHPTQYNPLMSYVAQMLQIMNNNQSKSTGPHWPFSYGSLPNYIYGDADPKPSDPTDAGDPLYTGDAYSNPPSVPAMTITPNTYSYGALIENDKYGYMHIYHDSSHLNASGQKNANNLTGGTFNDSYKQIASLFDGSNGGWHGLDIDYSVTNGVGKFTVSIYQTPFEDMNPAVTSVDDTVSASPAYSWSENFNTGSLPAGPYYALNINGVTGNFPTLNKLRNLSGRYTPEPGSASVQFVDENGNTIQQMQTTQSNTSGSGLTFSSLPTTITSNGGTYKFDYATYIKDTGDSGNNGQYPKYLLGANDTGYGTLTNDSGGSTMTYKGQYDPANQQVILHYQRADNFPTLASQLTYKTTKQQGAQLGQAPTPTINGVSLNNALTYTATLTLPAGSATRWQGVNIKVHLPQGLSIASGSSTNLTYPSAAVDTSQGSSGLTVNAINNTLPIDNGIAQNADGSTTVTIPASSMSITDPNIIVKNSSGVGIDMLTIPSSTWNGSGNHYDAKTNPNGVVNQSQITVSLPLTMTGPVPGQTGTISASVTDSYLRDYSANDGTSVTSYFTQTPAAVHNVFSSNFPGQTIYMSTRGQDEVYDNNKGNTDTKAGLINTSTSPFPLTTYTLNSVAPYGNNWPNGLTMTNPNNKGDWVITIAKGSDAYKQLIQNNSISMLVNQTYQLGLLSWTLYYQYTITEPINTWMPDKELQKSVLSQLNTPSTYASPNMSGLTGIENTDSKNYTGANAAASIQKSDMADLQYLYPASSEGGKVTDITNLQGLEYAQNLKALNLDGQTSLSLQNSDGTQKGLGNFIHYWTDKVGTDTYVPNWATQTHALPNLQELSMSNANLAAKASPGNTSDGLPEAGDGSNFAFTDLSNLKVVAFKQDGFTGNLPSSWGTNLGGHTLTGLSLAHNDFYGPVPSSWSNLANLSGLNLRYNHLSGMLALNNTGSQQSAFVGQTLPVLPAPITKDANGNQTALTYKFTLDATTSKDADGNVIQSATLPLSNFYTGILNASGTYDTTTSLPIVTVTAVNGQACNGDVVYDSTKKALVINNLTQFYKDYMASGHQTSVPITATVTSSPSGQDSSKNAYSSTIYINMNIFPILINDVDTKTSLPVRTQYYFGQPGQSSEDVNEPQINPLSPIPVTTYPNFLQSPFTDSFIANDETYQYATSPTSTITAGSLTGGNFNDLTAATQPVTATLYFNGTASGLALTHVPYLDFGTNSYPTQTSQSYPNIHKDSKGQADNYVTIQDTRVDRTTTANLSISLDKFRVDGTGAVGLQAANISFGSSANSVPTTNISKVIANLNSYTPDSNHNVTISWNPIDLNVIRSGQDTNTIAANAHYVATVTYNLTDSTE